MKSIFKKTTLGIFIFLSNLCLAETDPDIKKQYIDIQSADHDEMREEDDRN